jgi:TatD DNase family protein
MSNTPNQATLLWTQSEIADDVTTAGGVDAKGALIASAGSNACAPQLTAASAANCPPADRLLLETDSPYLAPVPHRGKRNEPGFVVHTARAIAAARNVSVEELACQTTANFERLFQLHQLH